ncbi:TetR family transcriptional regulator [Thalassomonas viridans]|uniref:TetR family transcriptional regulator n=1 Tax=Thalassomonas viridans TaxID=137584 RepID=A0AAE9Z4Z9_9GAMM|nr:TetR family transcriptional regulator [Thalassomonas viridans]WDE06154.1 TetR family transcriptional regulator [Thalassomonas viridans]
MPVNEKKRGRPAGAMKVLNAEVIVESAKSLMRDSGDVPSIRKLAASLNVDAMAIYHYFKNKKVLLEAITVSLIAGIYSPSASGQWQGELEQLSLSYLQLLNDYSGLLETLLSMDSAGPATVFSEKFHKIIKSSGLSEADEKYALDLLVDYLHGFAFAMSCNRQKGELTTEMIYGPLKLYFAGIGALIKK